MSRSLSVQLQTKTIFQPNKIPIATGTEENHINHKIYIYVEIEIR